MQVGSDSRAYNGTVKSKFMQLLIRLTVVLGSAAIGILGAGLLVSGFQVHIKGFFIVVVILAALQALLSPLVSKLIGRYIPALEGGIGLISTLIALFVASLIPAPEGISANSFGSWVVAGLVVWVVTAFASILISWFIERKSTKSA